MLNNSFSVSGVSSSPHHNPNLSTWGSPGASGTLSNSLTESLSQSRSHYQSGYLLSASQANNAPQGNQRVDEVPVVQTKAKMNHVLARGSASTYGMDSMFESSRQRRDLPDEDAPPMASVNDIPNEVYVDTSSTRFPSRSSLHENPFAVNASRRQTRPQSQSSIPSSHNTHQHQQPTYIIVFGYPPDKYNVTSEYFRCLGNSTDPEPNTEIVNAFRIGYMDAGDAMRALRKNGEVISGTWMIGVKLADPAQAEALTGVPAPRLTLGGISQSDSMAVDEPPTFATPTHPSRGADIGTPIRLAPSAAAFKKPGAGDRPSFMTHARGWSSAAVPPQPGAAASSNSPGGGSANPPATPSRGVLGQVSDLIFGW
ncbi:hypothetical protein AX16_004731 [Volvariella volvacea WC 439]|nr:hypothetical protein AX16_004731 [Volvariella volvacea WC 439]